MHNTSALFVTTGIFQARMAQRSASPPVSVESFEHSMKVEDLFTMEDLARIMAGFEGQANGMDMQQFCLTLSSLAGRSGVKREQLAQLFMKIDTSCDDRVDWDGAFTSSHLFATSLPAFQSSARTCWPALRRAVMRGVP